MRAVTDETLARRAQAGDGRAEAELMRRYERLATGAAHEFFIIGATDDDTRQEARMGLLRAIREFQPERGASFASYAYLSIRRALITAVKAATRGKHTPLNDSVRHGRNEDNDVVEVLTLLPAPNGDQLETLISKQEIRRLGRALRVMLSATEARCLILFANGATYEQVQKLTGLRSLKSVDSAIARARWKLAGEGPPSKPRYGHSIDRRTYVCPGCGLESVRVNSQGQPRRGPGRPPFCNVCTTRREAA